VAVTIRSAARHRHDLDLVAGLKQMATMTIADIKQSALANGNGSLAPRLPSERLGTIHDIDPLENIERELREIDEIIAGLNEEAEQPGEARKYAQTMLRQLTITRADFLAIKEKWL
jgi:hypothetical protein